MITEVTKIPKEGVLGIKKVLVYFNGSFPKRSYPIKDTTLPARLFPEANQFFIRCKVTPKNKSYFSEYFPRTNKLGEKITVFMIDEDFDKWRYAAD